MAAELDAVITEAGVLDNRPLSAATRLLVLDCPAVARAATPGRFVKLRAWPGPEENLGGPLLDRPFSIHRAEGGQLSLLYRIVGPATRLLSEVSPGAQVRLTGPLGRGLPEALTRRSGLYLVAGGIGLAPMALARDWLASAGGQATLFYGERTAAAQVEESWLKTWAGQDWVATVEDGSGYGRPGLVTEPLAQALQREARPIFACGPWPLLAAVANLARRYSAPALVSVEAGMACGLGVCLTCSLPLAVGGRFRACQEGPVVDALAVDWGAA
ncbi:MAG: dihydroorotate dehydrogenase electron transfer subunit [Candidatus Adiutrix sp.]|jgi:dihydroorotate dehydrogenase electron transfer subunit|nr:dihydroorotate dehydrogenase electron transfer subunit [Candidatus Adiutrix sp.]